MKNFKLGRIYLIPFLVMWAFVVLTRTISISGSPLQVQNPNVNINAVGGTTIGTSVPVTLTGGTSGTSGSVVTPAICSGTTCETSPVYTGAVTITSGSTSTLFAVTTGIDMPGTCSNTNNTSGPAVTLTLTDGNNVPYLGSTGGPSFSIPAGGNYVIQPGVIFDSGLRASASAASAIVCRIHGKQ